MQGDGFKPTAEQHCGIQELRSKCNDLQQALRDANQKVERQKAHIANIEQKRGEEKEQLHDAESELEKLEVMGRFLEGDNFLDDDKILKRCCHLEGPAGEKEPSDGLRGA